MPRRPRVLQVVLTLGTYGAEQVVMQLSRALPQHGVESAVATFFSPAPPVAAQQHERDIPLFDSARRGRYDVMFFPRLVAAIAAWEPDIVHTHTRYGKYWGRAAALAARVPAIVYTEHDNRFENRSLYRLANAALHPRTDAFVTFSVGHAQRFARAEPVDPARIHVIPNGIHVAVSTVDRARLRGELGLADEDFVVLRAARLVDSKYQALAIRAIAALGPQERGRMRLLVAGDGTDRPMLEALVAECGVNENVRFLGFRNDVMDLMRISDCVLFTSRYEGMPITLLEAMFSKVPVITTPWEGTEMLDHTLAVVLADWEPSTLARALTDAVRAPASLQAIAFHARERAEAIYTVDEMTRAHAELYARLLQ